MIGHGLRESIAQALVEIGSRARPIRRRPLRAWQAMMGLSVSAFLLVGTSAVLRSDVQPDAVALESSANLSLPQAAPEVVRLPEVQPPAPQQPEQPAPMVVPQPTATAVVDPLSCIDWVPSPNHSRRTAKIDTVVLHVTEDTLAGALQWFQSSASRVSAHYMVGRNGRIVQVVKEDQMAYHAGVVTARPGTRWYGTNPNYYSIGIEIESLKSFKTPADMPDAQREAVFALVRDVVTRHSIPIDRQHIVAHSEISPGYRSDPGPGFPWDDLMAQLQAGR